MYQSLVSGLALRLQLFDASLMEAAACEEWVRLSACRFVVLIAMGVFHVCMFASGKGPASCTLAGVSSAAAAVSPRAL
jgi:hypothetical protein